MVFVFAFIGFQVIAGKVQPLKVGDFVPPKVWKLIPKQKETQIVILDFWSTWCSSCMAAFPKMEKLQKHFGSRLQIVLINDMESEAKINQRFIKINANRIEGKKISLPQTLPTINGDTTFTELFPKTSVPHHVWLDRNGKVIAITEGQFAIEENVEFAIANGRIDLPLKDDLEVERRSNVLKYEGFVKPALADINIWSYSAFTGYLEVHGNAGQYYDKHTGTTRYCYFNHTIVDLFVGAFMGSVDEPQRILIEVTDSALLKNLNQPSDNEKYNSMESFQALKNWKSKYCFSYQVQNQSKDINDLRKKMQEDINRFFIDKFGLMAEVEKRKYKALILVKENEGLLKSNGGKELYIGPGVEDYEKNAGLTLVNSPIGTLITSLRALENMQTERPFIDETGIDNSLLVDVKLEGDLGNLGNIKRQLVKYGLNIIEAERELKVLVIKQLH
jgi:thiol-disulfide isomerase/thioredoxin